MAAGNIDPWCYCEFCLTQDKLIEVRGFCTKCEEYLCKLCFATHKDDPWTKLHVLQTKDEMPRLTNDQRKKQILIDMCDTHSDNPIEFYCVECDVLLCTACAITKHESCKGKLYLFDVVDNLDAHPIQKEFDKNFTDLGKSLQECDKSLKKNEHDIEKVFNETKKDAEETQQKLLTRLETWKESLFKETDNFARKDEEESQKATRSLKAVQTRFVELTESIDNTQGERRKVQRYINAIKSRDTVNTLESEANEINKKISHT